MRGVLGAVLLLCTANGTAATQPESPLAFGGLDGASHSLSELRGHPAVVNFWATWCSPCREEMPRIQKLAEAYVPRGVRFVAVSLDDATTQGKIAKVVDQRGFHVPIWTGASEATLTLLKLGELVPATLVMDENGEIIGRIEGEASEKDIRSRVDWLLNGRTGKQPKPVQRNDW